MDTITITNQSENDQAWEYSVQVGDGPDATTHTVTVPKSYWQSLTKEQTSPEDLVRKSFQFLLEREPKESILSRFDLPIIQQYFPKYEEEIF